MDFRARLSLLALAATAALFSLPSAAGAAVFDVDSTADVGGTICSVPCSLRRAVNDSAFGDADDVINVPAGNYFLSDQGRLRFEGGGTVTVNAIGGPVSVIRNDPMEYAVIDVATGTTVVLNGITITGGRNRLGGGIHNEGRLTLNQSTVSDNTAPASGGLPSQGGGIYNSGSLTLVDTVVSGNRAAGGTGSGESGAGGGIFNTETLTATRVRIEGNSADGRAAPDGAGVGGGLVTFGPSATLTDTAVVGNTAGSGQAYGLGGGIANNSGPVTVVRSTISGNKAHGGEAYSGVGGGVAANAGSFTITNSTISGNEAELGLGKGTVDPPQGGGIFVSAAAAVTLANVTTFENRAPGKDGAGGNIFQNSGEVTYVDTLVADGVADSGSNCAASGGVTHVNGRNLESTDQCGFAAGDLRNTDPLLGPLQANGGPTETHALLTGSPALDATTSCQATDQRGVTRPQGSACDVGAFELELAAPGGPLAVADTLAPAFTSARQSRTTWAVNPRGAPEVQASQRRRRPAKRGTEFRYTLSEAARVVFLVEQRTKGRRVGRACRKQSKRNRKRRQCNRFVRFGSFVQQGVAGANRKGFSGRIGRKRLKVGRWRITLVATDAAGNRSQPKRLSFRIVRG